MAWADQLPRWLTHMVGFSQAAGVFSDIVTDFSSGRRLKGGRQKLLCFLPRSLRSQAPSNTVSVRSLDLVYI